MGHYFRAFFKHLPAAAHLRGVGQPKQGVNFFDPAFFIVGFFISCALCLFSCKPL